MKSFSIIMVAVASLMYDRRTRRCGMACSPRRSASFPASDPDTPSLGVTSRCQGVGTPIPGPGDQVEMRIFGTGN